MVNQIELAPEWVQDISMSHLANRPTKLTFLPRCSPLMKGVSECVMMDLPGEKGIRSINYIEVTAEREKGKIPFKIVAGCYRDTTGDEVKEDCFYKDSNTLTFMPE